MRTTPLVAIPAVLLILGFGMFADAQGQGAGAGAQGAPLNARVVAPKDYTGYWVSVVAEHWHFRMLVPPKGDFTGLPLNPEARRVAGMWDPAKEPPGDGQCKAYGAPTLMRVPGRLHIHWADDRTLQIDTDAGTQTRLLRFGTGTAPAAKDMGWQGYSVATWEGIPAQELRTRTTSSPPDVRGEIKVMTTRLRSGYLRKNGIPYSENATLEEYFNRFREPNGDEWLSIDGIVRDPQYLAQPYVTSVVFKKQANSSGWDPTPCRADQPR